MDLSESTQHILVDRAQHYLHRSRSRAEEGTRWLFAETVQTGWCFPMSGVKEILEQCVVTPLPPQTRWYGHPCCGLILYQARPLPLLSWSSLVYEEAKQEWSEPPCLVLASGELALKMPSRVSIHTERFEMESKTSQAFRLGRLSSGYSVAHLLPLGVKLL